MVEALPLGERDKVVRLTGPGGNISATLGRIWGKRIGSVFHVNPSFVLENMDYEEVISDMDREELLDVVEEILKLRRERKPDFRDKDKARLLVKANE